MLGGVAVGLLTGSFSCLGGNGTSHGLSSTVIAVLSESSRDEDPSLFNLFVVAD